MKKKLILVAGIWIGLSALGFAEDSAQVLEPVKAQDSVGEAVEKSEAEESLVEAGNKICPVSKEAIGSMGEGYKIAHNGKVYNLCCEMCAAEFNKDPEGYIKMIMENEGQGEVEEHSHQQ